MKSFPPPLTPKEESELLRRSADGDNEARHILIERNLRLVAHVIKKYQHLEDDTEDLLSIGTIGLIKAVSTFNPDKKARLATYACRCIENELLMMLRTKRKSNRETSRLVQTGKGMRSACMMSSNLMKKMPVCSLP